MTPRLDAYLASLPEGLDSFPDCRSKGSLFRASLKHRPLESENLPEDLPAPLRELIEQPPTASAWRLSVEYFALSLLIADLRGMSDGEFGRFWYDVMKDVATGKLYSVMLRFITPARVLKITASGWGRFHQGWSMHSLRRPSGIELSLEHPAGLLPELCVRAYAQVWQAVIDCSAKPEALARLVSVDDTRATYRCSGWQ